MKLPLGIIGGFRGDFSDSVENEWLCAQILRELDLPVADAAIEGFGEQRALVVTRFDRRWIGFAHRRNGADNDVQDYEPVHRGRECCRHANARKRKRATAESERTDIE